MIELHGLTKKFAQDKGLFDVSFTVEPGTVFGFIGPNGAGKSTAIRHLMGLLQPDSGNATIGGYNCWSSSPEVKKLVGYLPGEISFPSDLTGDDILTLTRRMDTTSSEREKELLTLFPLDTKVKVRKMSKGMKQKLAIIRCFMKDAPVYLLDEPTSGLDPLMQERFLELVLREKEAGKAILMSSHHFPEMEKTCDYAALIRNGRIVVADSIDSLIASSQKMYHVEFVTAQAAHQFSEIMHGKLMGTRVDVSVSTTDELNTFLQTLAAFRVTSFRSAPADLETVFIHYYAEEESV
ncbi:ABC transporter ATP-binding protein [Chryseomicrobium sp. FSL W7-1435]|uniref:ABC transporter ATP-binding protein n=1 Tax=Chryseomicrobium sp. FSL W7-1435 TaxID=2921704 RepID=UPI00315A55B3